MARQAPLETRAPLKNNALFLLQSPLVKYKVVEVCGYGKTSWLRGHPSRARRRCLAASGAFV